MHKFVIAFLLCVALSVEKTSASPFDPSTASEFFWCPNDNGEVVPAHLHGRPKNYQPRGIADDVQFYLFHNKNPSTQTEIFPGSQAGLDNFMFGKPTVILAHGFSSSSDGGFGNGLRERFAQAPEDINLIFVNWAALAAAPWYELAADSTKPVGEYTAMLIEHLVSEGQPLSLFHFGGHSLGSHIGNFIARNLTIGKLPRITALDPALPLFGVREDDERIDSSDAEFVDVIHTAMGTLADGGLAFTEPRGHADYYPNSGAPPQPGCEGNDAFGACSHSKAHEYFGTSAANRNAFVGCKCDSWDDFLDGCENNCQAEALMGYGAPSSASGLFYLRTA